MKRSGLAALMDAGKEARVLFASALFGLSSIGGGEVLANSLPPIEESLALIDNVTEYREVAISPDGHQVGRIGAWRPLTTAVSNQRSSGKVESISWRRDQFSVQGWVLYPANFDARQRYPLIVWVHGGPAALSAPHWPSAPFYPDFVLAMQGYLVFYPNPGGSAGFGVAFKRSNIRDFGGVICTIFVPVSTGCS